MSNTNGLRDAGWGVFAHYLESPPSSEYVSDTSADAWNARVDSFDVERLAAQLYEVGAGYFGLTIGQNSGHFCSPNATYDSFVGRSPSLCSRRDLIADVADALAARDIRFMAYLPSAAPEFDALAVEKLHWTKGAYRNADFQRRWEAVIREWSERWGERVSAWWLDGCYWPDEMYHHDDAPNFATFAAALKAGNSDALVAFNPGVKTPIISMTPHENFTAGELDNALALGFATPDCHFRPIEPSVQGRQFHILTYLGASWAKGPPRFPVEMVRGYTDFVTKAGGAITWDVPISDDGALPEEFMEQLRALPSTPRFNHQSIHAPFLSSS